MFRRYYYLEFEFHFMKMILRIRDQGKCGDNVKDRICGEVVM